MPQWLDDLVEGATKYSPLIKTGVAALSTYASFKDQQKKNELQKAAYDDYMAQADAAGHAARAAIDINYTPMTVSGVPQTKADVTDFTAVAAQGGLMSIPNKQRKRYATGPAEIEVMEMDEEVLTPFDLQKETGIDVLGEQVFYDTGKGDRSNAQMIWNSMQDGDKAIFDFDFELFFMDDSWRDMIKGQVDVQEDTEMASAPDPNAEMNDFSMNIFGKPLHQLTPLQLDQLYELMNEQSSVPQQDSGIMQAARGGRIGYGKGGSIAKLIDGGMDPSTALSMWDDWKDSGSQLSFEDYVGYGTIDNYAQGGRIGYRDGTGSRNRMSELMFKLSNGTITDEEMIELRNIESASMFAQGGRIGYDAGGNYEAKIKELMDKGMSRELAEAIVMSEGPTVYDVLGVDTKAKGGRIGYQEGIGPNQGSPSIMANAATDMEVEDAYGTSVGDAALQRHIIQLAEQSANPQDFPATDSDYSALEKLSEQTDVSLEEIIQVAKALNFKAPQQAQGEMYSQYMAHGGRIGYANGTPYYDDGKYLGTYKNIRDFYEDYPELKNKRKNKNRKRKANGGIMDLGGLEKDYRTTGGFVPIGEYEKKDDVPARLSKNEFVMTADAVRAAGGGSINKGAQRMYDTMKNLEAQPQAKRMTA